MKDTFLGLLIVVGFVLAIPLFILALLSLEVMSGYFLVWLVTFTPFAAWIVQGLALMNMHVAVSQLPYIGAVAGLFSAFLIPFRVNTND